MMLTILYIMFLCALNVFAGPADTNEGWVVGQWISVRSEISPTNALPPELERNLTEKHVLIFLPDGNIQRYSVKNGLKNWAFAFKTVGHTLHLRYPYGFEPSGHLTDNGTLVLDYRRWHKVVYRRVGEDEDLGELTPKGDLLGKGCWSKKKSQQQDGGYSPPTVRTSNPTP